MEFKHRYDIILTFNHKIAEHFYSGDYLVGGINEQTVSELFSRESLGSNDFFPELLKDLTSLFGEEDFSACRCDLGDSEITFYYSVSEPAKENFEKKCLGWVMLKDLDNAFLYYAIIDFENKDFIVRDVKGFEKRDKLKIIQIKDDQVIN